MYKLLNQDIYWMKRCLELASQAKVQGNTAVGSLITIENILMVESEELTPSGDDPFAHAELVAVREACRKLSTRKLSNATLYTTVEPCFLCSYAIRSAGLQRVVIGCLTPEIGGASSNYPILAATDITKWGIPPKITWHILEQECRQMLKKD